LRVKRNPALAKPLLYHCSRLFDASVMEVFFSISESLIPMAARPGQPCANSRLTGCAVPYRSPVSALAGETISGSGSLCVRRIWKDAGMSEAASRAKGGTARTEKTGRIGAKPLMGLAAGAAVGSAAIAAALIFSGRLRNPFVDAAALKEDGVPPDATAPSGGSSALSGPGDPEDASFERGDR
jgi:hypothetical protein